MSEAVLKLFKLLLNYSHQILHLRSIEISLFFKSLVKPKLNLGHAAANCVKRVDYLLHFGLKRYD